MRKFVLLIIGNKLTRKNVIELWYEMALPPCLLVLKKCQNLFYYEKEGFPEYERLKFQCFCKH